MILEKMAEDYAFSLSEWCPPLMDDKVSHKILAWHSGEILCPLKRNLSSICIETQYSNM